VSTQVGVLSVSTNEAPSLAITSSSVLETKRYSVPLFWNRAAKLGSRPNSASNVSLATFLPKRGKD
ncbi:MAG: hypothetical protein PHO46_06075, partial [Thermoguttaceae bacterium]|nr:hypothetical protein [Thermoguttaceae bacterium]